MGVIGFGKGENIGIFPGGGYIREGVDGIVEEEEAGVKKVRPKPKKGRVHIVITIGSGDAKMVEDRSEVFKGEGGISDWVGV